MDASTAARDHEAHLEGQNCRLQEQGVIESECAGVHGEVSVRGMDFEFVVPYWPILSKTVAARIMSSTLG